MSRQTKSTTPKLTNLRHKARSAKETANVSGGRQKKQVVKAKFEPIKFDFGVSHRE